jgi:hypothetical protein
MKKTLDQHFTPAEVAKNLVDRMVTLFDPLRVRSYVEPAVGGGVFLDALLRGGVKRNRITTLDLDPAMNPDIVTDFLLWEPEVDDYIVIGNPPFGKQGALAWKFKEHATTFAPVCGFIMPLSASKRGGDVISELEVSFDTTSTKCCWMEWYIPALVPLVMHPEEPPMGGLEFVTPKDKYDIVIQRCGAKIGQITTCNGSGQGKYYICAKESVLEAVRVISEYLKYAPEAFLSSQQPSLSHSLVHRLVRIAFFSLNCS